MTRDDIIRMAREALERNVDYNVWTISTPHLEEFARLVAAHEREACAKVCDDLVLHQYSASGCAAAIRERSIA